MSSDLYDNVAGGGLVADPSALLALLVLAGIVAMGFVSRLVLLRARRLAPPEVQERIDAGMDLLVLDVRSRAAFADGHVAGAVNVPLSGLRGALSSRGDALPVDSDHVVVVIADRTSRAERAADRLRRSGFNRVYVVEGGMRGWREDRLPLADTGDAHLAVARH